MYDQVDPDVIRTIYGEANDQGPTGWQAVASVIRNRANNVGADLGSIVRAPGQFEGLHAARGLDPASADYQRIASAVTPILNGASSPITDADAFYSPKAQAALGRSAPAWDDGSGVDLGGHRFFRTGWGGGKARVQTPVAQDLKGGAGSPLDELAGPDNSGPAPAPAQGQAAPARPQSVLDDLAGPDASAPPAAAPGANPAANAPRYAPGADKGVYNAQTGLAANDAQAHTLRALQAAGKLNIDPSNPGSGADNPTLSTDATATPAVGKWYVGLDGVVRQAEDKGVGIARADEAAKAASLAKVPRIPGLADFTDSLTAPVNDEMAGGIAAASQGLYNLGAKTFGAPVSVTMGDRYTAALEQARATQDARAKADPVATTLGGLAGGFALGPEAGGGGALKAAAQVLGTGAVYGAADARGGLGDRVQGGAQGAALAGLTGLGLAGAGGLARMAPRLPIVGGALRAAGRGANEALGGVFGAEPIPAGVVPPGVAPNDAGTAARYVQGLASAAGVTPADLAASDAPTVAEGIGRPALSHAAMLARRSGTSGDLADQVFLSRRDARPARILQTLSDVSGVEPEFIAGDHAAQMAGLRKAAGPLYDAAYNSTPPQSTLLDYLSTRPSVKAGISRAYKIAQEEGRDPEALGLRDMEAPADPTAPDEAGVDTGPTFGEVLAGLRRGDSAKLSQGPTAIQFIGRNGGISDPGGDLAAMDAGKAHVGKPFWNKLLNPEAPSADGWALRLQEQGYLPDVQPDQRPSIDDVHSLISDELQGLPTYGRQADPRALELQGRIQDMGDHLRIVHGVDQQDLPKFSDDKIAEMLNPVESGPHPYAPPPMEPVFSAEPSMQTWDYVKRGMNDVLEKYRDGTTGKLNLDDQGRAMVGTVGRLRDELVRVNPAYGEALKAGGEPLRQEQAFRVAPQLLGDHTPEAEFNRQYSAFTPAQRKAFQGGAINNLYVQARQGRLNVNTLKSPAMASKMYTMFGNEGSAKITAMLGREKAMVAAERSVPPGAGSPTYGLAAASREADGGEGLVAGLGADMLHSVAAHPLNPKMGMIHFAGTQARKLAAVARTGGMSQPVRDEAGRLLMTMSPAEFAAHLQRLLPGADVSGVGVKPVRGLFGGAGGVRPALPVGLLGSLGVQERRGLLDGY